MKKSALVILKHKDRFLLHLRDNKSEIEYPNSWGLIGGRLEEGETPLQAIKRETKEEIGLNIRDLIFLDEVIYIDETYGYEGCLFFFFGIINEKIDEITLNEGQEINYFTLEEMQKLQIPPVIKEFIMKKSKYLLGF